MKRYILLLATVFFVVLWSCEKQEPVSSQNANRESPTKTEELTTTTSDSKQSQAIDKSSHAGMPYIEGGCSQKTVGILGSWFAAEIATFLTNSGHIAVTVDQTFFNNGGLNSIDVLFLIRNGISVAISNITDIETFVNGGGILITEFDATVFVMQNFNFCNAGNLDVTFGMPSGTYCGGNTIMIKNPNNPLAAGLPSSWLCSGDPIAVWKVFRDLDPNFDVVATLDGDQNNDGLNDAVVATCCAGEGVWIAFFTDFADWEVLQNPRICEPITCGRTIEDEILMLNAVCFDIYNVGKCKNEPPVAICQNVTVTADNNNQAVVSPEEVDNGSFDPDGDEITLSLDPPGPYPLGDIEVTLTVMDESNESNTCQATITVEDKEPIDEAVVVAVKSIWIKQSADILSGNVIVNDTVPGLSGPYLDSGVELAVGEDVTTAAGYSLKAHRIKVKQNAVVNSEVFFNELDNNGTVNGAQNSPLELTVFGSLPEFKSEPAGIQNIIVAKNGSISLNNTIGYGDILVKQNGIILFTGGGTFKMRSLNTGISTKLLFDAPTEILIEEKFDTDQNSYVGPDVGAAIDGSDIIFYVAGINGNNGNLGATPKAAQVGLHNTVFANFYVPNGTLWLRQNSNVTGGFIGKDVIVGINVQVNLDNGFGISLTKTAAFTGSNDASHFTSGVY